MAAMASQMKIGSAQGGVESWLGGPEGGLGLACCRFGSEGSGRAGGSRPRIRAGRGGPGAHFREGDYGIPSFDVASDNTRDW